MAFVSCIPYTLCNTTRSSSTTTRTTTRTTAITSSLNPHNPQQHQQHQANQQYRSSSPRFRQSRRAFLFTLATTSITALPLSNNLFTMAADGPQIIEITEGDGVTPKKGDTLYLNYTLTLGGFQDAGGKVVDSSRSRGSLFS